MLALIVSLSSLAYGMQPGERQLEVLARAMPSEAECSAEAEAVAVLAAGCFWGVELAFERLPGVKKAESGYTGGHAPNPTYKMVTRGDTMHAEAVRITYNPSILSYADLLSVFFDVHDPTQRNRQGNDVGTQYRSTIFYGSEEERSLAVEAITAEESRLGRRVATTVEPLATFTLAEDYHQNYLAERGQSSAKGSRAPIRCYG